MKRKAVERQVGTYAVVFEKTRTGYSAYAPDLPGCIAAGDTVRQTAELMRKAIEIHVAGIREDGLPVPKPTHTTVSAASSRNGHRSHRATAGTQTRSVSRKRSARTGRVKT